MRFPYGNLGDEETEFRRIAWSRITCRDVVQHRDGDWVAGVITNEPPSCRIMIDAIEGDPMAVLGQDRLQQIEVEYDGSTIFCEHERIVRRLPQFIGRWVQDEVGHGVGDQGEFMLGHAAIYAAALERPSQSLIR
jgi:hypothetical protein